MTEPNKQSMDWMAIAQAGGQLFNSISGAVTSRKNLKQQIAHEKEQSDLAYQRAIEQRDYMNQYNSPVMQMKRFSEAGLNPHLIYGKGSAGQQQTTPQYQKAAADFSLRKPIQVPDMLGTYLGTLQSRAQTENLNKDIEVKEEQINTEQTKQALNMANSRNADVRTAGQAILNSYADRRQKAELDKLQSERDRIIADIAFREAQTTTEGRKAGLIGAQKRTEMARAAQIRIENAYRRVQKEFEEAKLKYYRNYTAKGFTESEVLVQTAWNELLEGKRYTHAQLQVARRFGEKFLNFAIEQAERGIGAAVNLK